MDLWSLVKKGFIDHPEKTAVVHGNLRLTFKELEQRINKAVNMLYGLGLKKGDAVAILAENSLMALEAQYALFKGGFIWTPLTFRNHPKENAYYLNNSGAKAIIFQGQFAQGIESVKSEIQTVEYYIVDKENTTYGMHSYSHLMDKASIAPFKVDIHEDDPLCLLHTSGTTGKSKACLHTHKSWIMMTFAAITMLNVQPTDVLLHVAAINHGAGSSIPCHMMFGVPQIMLSHMDVENLLETIQKEKVTTIWMAPTMIYLLLAHPKIHDYDLSSLRLIPYSSSPISANKLKEALVVFGNKFLQAYGLTECPVISSLNQKEHLAGVQGNEETAKTLASAGREIILTEINIIDSEGNELPRGEIGEIIVRSPLCMKEYWNNPDATAATIKNGWLHTGDLGYMDDEGYLHVADRIKDMIISGGYNVYPKEVEDAIFMHPAVLETAVIGIPDSVWGESVKAFVVLKPNMQATEKDIIQICMDNMASYKKPKSVEFLNDLPKSVTGKILKRELRKEYWNETERQI